MIQKYNFDVTTVLKFQGKPRGEVFYGVELELELGRSYIGDPERVSDQVEEMFPKFFKVKHDGSLNCGFEIVTAPASLKIHKLRWKRFFETEWVQKTFVVESTCGLHVHFSKRPLTEKMLEVMGEFINDPKNYTWQTKLGRRKENQFCEFKSWGSKYQALNLRPTTTGEVRFFASTLDVVKLLLSLEYVGSLVEWLRTRRIQEVESTGVSGWMEFVEKQKLWLPNLQKWVEKNKKLINRTGVEEL